MKKSVAVAVIGLAAGFGFIESSAAEDRAWEWSPVGIGIAAPIQLPFASSDVYGLRLGVPFAWNQDVYGLDVGVAGLTMGDFRGLQVAGMSWTEGNVYGVQLSALADVVVGKLTALQAAPVNVVWDDACGFQAGLLNYDGSTFAGIQVGGVLNWNRAASYGFQVSAVNANQDEFVGWSLGGLVNYSEKFSGFACGLVNVSYEVTGYQLGLVNACERMRGVQIGLLNLICESKLPIMVIANASF